jgi:hypothetical protein
MRLTWRDALATVFVLAAVVVYGIWLVDDEVLGTSSVRTIGLVVMLLGLASSVTAVVYGVGAGLLRASKVYLMVTSLVGLGALVAGILVLVQESEPMLGGLVIATASLWLMSTIRHVLIATKAHQPGIGSPPLPHAA